MSRSSKRVATYYVCMGACPRKGKRFTSRYLRRKAQHLCHESRMRAGGEGWDFYAGDLDVHVDHPQDKLRGSAGSRDPDRGWYYYGDGRARLFPSKVKPREHLPLPWEESRKVVPVRHYFTTRELAQKLRRK